MNRWEKKFSEHEIHATVELLTEGISKGFKNLDEDEVVEKRRFLKLIASFKSALKNIDPELMSFKRLDALNNSLKHPTLKSNVDAYAKNGTVANIVSANDFLERSLEILARDESLNSLESLIDTTSETLISEKDALINELNELKKSIKEHDEKLEQSITEKAQKLEELTAQIDTNKTNIDSQISTWQSQFSTAQDSRSNDFVQWKDSFSKDSNSNIEKVISDYKEKLEGESLEFKEEINSILADGNDKHQAILDLYELTAGDSVAAGYLKNANEEKKQADIWRWFSIAFLISTVFWMFFSYTTHKSQKQYAIQFNEPVAQVSSKEKTESTKKSIVKAIELSSKNEDFPWFELFLTFSISGVLLWGGAYSAQQSTKHRNNEKRTRWFALEVKAIDPFISSLEPAQQNELKKEFTNKLFGNSFSEVSEDPQIADEHLLKFATGALDKVLSKIK